MGRAHGGARYPQVALIADAANTEIDRLNARAQHLRAERGELGHHEIPLPGVHYGLREGDLIAFTAQHRPRGQPRVENGTRGPGQRHPRSRRDHHDRRITAQNPTRQRAPRLAEVGLRAARLPPAGRDRRALRRAHRRLADQQGDRLRRGNQSTPRHRLVHRTRRPRRRRTRPPTHHAAGPAHAVKQSTDTLTCLPGDVRPQPGPWVRAWAVATAASRTFVRPADTIRRSRIRSRRKSRTLTSQARSCEQHES